MNVEALSGRLLVATPVLADPNFSHSVVLLLEHSEEGAVGVVLNRPSEVTVTSALPAWSALAAAPKVVFLGGPVQVNSAVIGLGRVSDSTATVQPVLPDVGIVQLGVDPAQQAAGLSAVRLFAGYGGWGKGQLEREVGGGGWFVVDARADDVFSAAPQRLWRQVLLRQGGVFRTVAENPSLN